MICGYYGNSGALIFLRHPLFAVVALRHPGGGCAYCRLARGMVTSALSLELEDRPRLKLLCILYWDFSHFIVLVKARRQRLIIDDSARGRRQIPLSVLAKHFTQGRWKFGSVITFTAKIPAFGLHLRALIRGRGKAWSQRSYDKLPVAGD